MAGKNLTQVQKAGLIVIIPIFHHKKPPLQSYFLVQTAKMARKCDNFCSSKHCFQLSWAGQPTFPTHTTMVHFILGDYGSQEEGSSPEGVDSFKQPSQGRRGEQGCPFK